MLDLIIDVVLSAISWGVTCAMHMIGMLSIVMACMMFDNEINDLVCELRSGKHRRRKARGSNVDIYTWDEP